MQSNSYHTFQGHWR